MPPVRLAADLRPGPGWGPGEVRLQKLLWAPYLRMMEAKKAEEEAQARKEEEELLFGAEEEAQEAKNAEEEAQAKIEEKWQFLVSTSAIFAKGGFYA